MDGTWFLKNYRYKNIESPNFIKFDATATRDDVKHINHHVKLVIFLLTWMTDITIDYRIK